MHTKFECLLSKSLTTLEVMTHYLVVHTGPGRYCSGQTTLAHTYTICIICTRGRASPPSTVRQRTPPLSSLCPSDNCELPVASLRMALQVQGRAAESLPYPQIEAQCHPRDRGIIKIRDMLMGPLPDAVNINQG